MTAGRSSNAASFQLLQGLEDAAVCSIAGAVNEPFLIGLLRVVSRFGDWGLSVTAGLLLLATVGLRAATVWTGSGIAAVLLQKTLKRTCGRTRPCERPGGPPQRVGIPDRGSFPSGHTLHAAMAAVVVTALIPAAGPFFAALALLMATSRVVLGVHYLSDVAVGGAIGALLAWAVLTLI